MEELSLTLPTEADTEQLGQLLAAELTPPCVIYLMGDLGAGKTRLTRAVLQSKGHNGVVKSPTYTLVEPYQIAQQQIYHFDLYRLTDPSELEYMGIRDYFTTDALVFVEWPDHGKGYIDNPDITITMSYDGDGRQVNITAHTDWGSKIINQLKLNL